MKKIILMVVVVVLIVFMCGCSNNRVHIESFEYSGCYYYTGVENCNNCIKFRTLNGDIILDDENTGTYLFLFEGEECPICKINDSAQ